MVVLPAPKAQKAIKCCASAEGAMVSESRKKTKLYKGLWRKLKGGQLAMRRESLRVRL